MSTSYQGIIILQLFFLYIFTYHVNYSIQIFKYIYFQGTYGIKVYKILSNCHISQSGSLIFCICRIVGRAHVSVSSYFVKLAMKRCQYLLTLSKEDSNTQMPLDDLQMALEMLHKDRVDKRY